MIPGANIAYGLSRFPTNGPFPSSLVTHGESRLDIQYDLPFTFHASEDTESGSEEKLSDFYFCCANKARSTNRCNRRTLFEWPR